MPSSRSATAVFCALGLLLGAADARAQQTAQGFAVERLAPSAPGGGWFVMDSLDWRGGLGGVMALTTGYASKPLRVTDGTQHLAVVSDQAFADFGFAVTWQRWRLYLDLDMPLLIKGDGGTVGGYQLTGPQVDLGSNPDTLGDARIGLDARLLGEPGGAFRLGAGAQLFTPNGHRADYVSDGTFRAMFRALAAGDVGRLTYAAHAGVHVRPLDDSPAPGSPRGSELLFGAAAGARFPLDCAHRRALVVGPEVFGASALGALFGTTTTSLEGLLSARIEGTADDGPQMRVRLGTGAGLDPHFGAPAWRFVLGVEISDHAH
jgi:hypothetical protein